jgi:hypothetical protein
LRFTWLDEVDRELAVVSSSDENSPDQTVDKKNMNYSFVTTNVKKITNILQTTIQGWDGKVER